MADVHAPGDKPAGGRGAIRGTVRAWSRQGIPLKLIGSFLTANKVHGFDCPGCAFPDKTGRHLVDSCEQGQKAIAWEMTRKAVGAEFFDGKTPAQLQSLGDFDLEFQGRLTTPVLYERGAGVFRAIDWDEAYAISACELAKLPPQSVAFYASGRSSNEAAFLWQLAARTYGSANLPDSSNFCHEPSGYALKQSIGTGKGTCSLDDFEHADLFIVIGQNPASNHPRMMAALYEAKKRGATILVVNPLRERGFTHFSDPKNVGELLRDQGIAVADAIYQVTIGGDLAMLKGVMKALLEMERSAPGRVFDHDFIEAHTEGLDALLADLDACAWNVLVERSGLADTVATFDAAMHGADYAAVTKTIPPKVLGFIANKGGIDVAKLREVVIEQMAKALAEVKIEDFSMDLAKAEYRELETGEPYVLIPTETIMDAGDKGKFKATSQTLAFMDEGEWYLLRVNEQQQVEIMREVYPQFVGVEFDSGSVEALK